jgi:hypothetical protein
VDAPRYYRWTVQRICAVVVGEVSNMGEHRVTMLGAALGRREDPAQSGDPRVRHLVGALATAEPAPSPSADFRAELRAQLVAVAPRLIAEGERVEASATVGRGAVRPAPAGARHRPLLRRPLAIATSILTVFAVLLGGAVWLSQHAVPGDTLYGLKRASESVQLSLTSGSAAKGKKYLELATTRSEEVTDLLSHPSAAGPGLQAAGPPASGVSSRTAALVTSTLHSADSDVRTGTRLLGAQAVRENSSAPLAIITAWAPGQFARLQTIVASLPAGSLQTRARASSDLVLSALNRAAALMKLSGCSCLRTAPTDSLGPVPCTVCPAPSATPVAPTATTPGASPSPATTGTGRTTTPGTAASTGATGTIPTLPGQTLSTLSPSLGTGVVASTLPTSGLPTTPTTPPLVTISLPPLLPDAPSTSAPSTSAASTNAPSTNASPASTCSLRVVIANVLAINTCTGLYVSLS